MTAPRASTKSIKDEFGFEAKLLAVLLPKGHPNWYYLDNDEFVEQMVQSLKNRLDGPICTCVDSRFRRVLRIVFAGRPRRTKRKFVVSSQARAFLRAFAEHVYKEQGQNWDRQVSRRAEKRLAVIVYEVIRRCDLVYNFV